MYTTIFKLNSSTFLQSCKQFDFSLNWNGFYHLSGDMSKIKILLNLLVKPDWNQQTKTYIIKNSCLQFLSHFSLILLSMNNFKNLICDCLICFMSDPNVRPQLLKSRQAYTTLHTLLCTQVYNKSNLKSMHLKSTWNKDKYSPHATST